MAIAYHAPVFLILSKTLDLFIAPVTWALVLVVLGILWTKQRPGRARFCLVLALLVLVVFSLEGVSRRLYARLEARAVSTFHPEPPYDVAIVLGGMMEPSALVTGQLELNESSERILAAADLLRTGQARAVLVTGGSAFPRPGERPEAEVLGKWLRDQGYAADRIFIETGSRNTRENATLSAPIVAAHGWKRILLVTSAWHAPRAMGCFRAVGIEADLLPVDHRSVPSPIFAWVPRAAHLSDSSDALRELFGGLVYRLRGYTK
jgi:uncharacterized SAM-binding protein YcdF (DUF218 family)